MTNSSEDSRLRNKQIRVWLFEEEYAVLQEKVKRAGINISEFIRNLIVYGTADKTSNFSSDDAMTLIDVLSNISNAISHISYQSKINNSVNENDFAVLEERFSELINVFDDYFRS